MPANDLPLSSVPDDVLEQMAKKIVLEIHEKLEPIPVDELPLPSNLLSMVSHELKTPVTSLRTLLQVLQRRMQGDTSKFNFVDNAEYIGFSLREVDRLTVLINDLLDFNRITRGALQFNFSVMDLQPIIVTAVENMVRVCRTHRIMCEGETAYLVQIDAPRFEQVFTNLVTNAIKYSDHDSLIMITVTEGPEEVSISVRDDGIGIAVEHQVRIFEPYYRTPAAIASGIGGLGIGLYMSLQIVQAHHGTITVSSAQGKGTTATITLPKSKLPIGSELVHTLSTVPLSLPVA